MEFLGTLLESHPLGYFHSLLLLSLWGTLPYSGASEDIWTVWLLGCSDGGFFAFVWG